MAWRARYTVVSPTVSPRSRNIWCRSWALWKPSSSSSSPTMAARCRVARVRTVRKSTLRDYPVPPRAPFARSGAERAKGAWQLRGGAADRRRGRGSVGLEPERRRGATGERAVVRQVRHRDVRAAGGEVAAPQRGDRLAAGQRPLRRPAGDRRGARGDRHLALEATVPRVDGLVGGRAVRGRRGRRGRGATAGPAGRRGAGAGRAGRPVLRVTAPGSPGDPPRGSRSC